MDDPELVEFAARLFPAGAVFTKESAVVCALLDAGADPRDGARPAVDTTTMSAWSAA